MTAALNLFSCDGDKDHLRQRDGRSGRRELAAMDK
jgi:hypothetical protein